MGLLPATDRQVRTGQRKGNGLATSVYTTGAIQGEDTLMRTATMFLLGIRTWLSVMVAGLLMACAKQEDAPVAWDGANTGHTTMPASQTVTYVVAGRAAEGGHAASVAKLRIRTARMTMNSEIRSPSGDKLAGTGAPTMCTMAQTSAASEPCSVAAARCFAL